MNKQAYIYYIMVQYRNSTNFKVGYTANLEKRMLHYITHNTEVKLLEYIIIDNAKSGRILEKDIHKEQRIKGELFKGWTEWITVDISKEEEYINKGLKQFECIKHYNIKDICKVAR